MIPESVKKEIEEKSKVHESATPHEGLGPALFSEGAAFGYSLASEEIERLKGLLKEFVTDGCIDQYTKDYTWNVYIKQHNL